MNKTSKDLEIAGKKLTLETGELARLATSSVLARLGDTMVLVTVVEGGVRDDIDYFPLSVEYVERLYAGGRIKGSRWVKREGRPSDDAILTGRLIDRSIRPLFPKNYKNEVQVVVTVLSVDNENEPNILSIIATSAALSISPIPWNGPVSAVRMGLIKEKDNGNKEFIVNPDPAEADLSEIDLVATQTKDKTLMLEAGANEISEDLMLSAIEKAHEENKKIISFIEDLRKKIGKEKHAVSESGEFLELTKILEKKYKDEIDSLFAMRVAKESTKDEVSDQLIDKIYTDLSVEAVPPGRQIKSPYDKKAISKAIEYVIFKNVRKNIIEKKARPDKRAVDEIRPLEVKVGILPRTHGSAIFQRGETQVLSVATLGSPRLEQLIESAEGEEVKRYMHHYSFPPYSVGEAGRMFGPSRREIGHGALAERAILSVIPNKDVFPYTVRVVSEVLTSNGSTSMASVSGSTLALMDAGVPIKNPVAGIAMGLMTQGEKYVILTDIIGLEDFSGDMDFKVAGSKIGITAIQLDVKIPGLTIAQIKETFEGAKKARATILDKMQSVIASSRGAVSEYAPKIDLLHIPVDKIGELIGPGGRVIKNIIATTGATVDVEDDGSVTISATSEDAVSQAVTWIQGLIREVGVGEEFEGEVKRILPFGAFVEILPGKEGMVHVSQMSDQFVKNPSDVVSIGQKVKVKVIEIDEQARINLSMLDKPKAPREEGGGFNKRREGGGGDSPSGGYPSQQRPYPKSSSSSAPRDFNRTPAAPATTGKSSHPLAMQFRREREERERKERINRRPPYKKTHF